jgi:hypothetical protein
MVFGIAVVLLMMWRPQGVITRTLLERWRAFVMPAGRTAPALSGADTGAQP